MLPTGCPEFPGAHWYNSMGVPISVLISTMGVPIPVDELADWDTHHSDSSDIVLATEHDRRVRVAPPHEFA